MSEKRFPPRLFVVLKVEKDGHHTYIAHGSKWISEYGEIKEYLSINEHQHILAEKEKRIERLEHCLEWLAAGFAGMWGSESKMWYDHALETAPDMIKAALQEKVK